MDLSRFGPSVNPLAQALASGPPAPGPGGAPDTGGMSPEMRALLPGGAGGPSILPPITATPGAGAPNIAGLTGYNNPQPATPGISRPPVAMPPGLSGSIPGGLPNSTAAPGTGLPPGANPINQFLNKDATGTLPSAFTRQGISPLPSDNLGYPAGLQGQGLSPIPSGPVPMPAAMTSAIAANTPTPPPGLPSSPGNASPPPFGFGSLNANTIGR